MNSIKVCEYSRSRSFHDDLILQDQASGERSQDQWSSGYCLLFMGAIAGSRINSIRVRMPTIWVPTRFDTDRAVQSQKMARLWKFWI